MSTLPQEFYLEIKRAYPNIKSEDITIYDDGWDYLVCAIEDKEVFRFPRRDDCATTLPREVSFLKTFLSPVPLPDMNLYQFDDQRPYVRYQFLNGSPFNPEVAEKLSSDKLRKIAVQLGQFLSALHSFPTKHAESMGFKEGDILTMWNKNFEKAQIMVFPLITKQEQEWIEQLFNAFFQTVKKSKIIKRLTHGDIIARHILIDEQQGMITGIIDFGDMSIGDPAFDFAYLGNYGKEFLDTVYANYLVGIDVTFEERRKFYESRWLIAELEHAIALKNEADTQKFKDLLSEYIGNFSIK